MDSASGSGNEPDYGGDPFRNDSADDGASGLSREGVAQGDGQSALGDGSGPTGLSELQTSERLAAEMLARAADLEPDYDFESAEGGHRTPSPEQRPTDVHSQQLGNQDGDQNIRGATGQVPTGTDHQAWQPVAGGVPTGRGQTRLAGFGQAVNGVAGPGKGTGGAPSFTGWEEAGFTVQQPGAGTACEVQGDRLLAETRAMQQLSLEDAMSQGGGDAPMSGAVESVPWPAPSHTSRAGMPQFSAGVPAGSGVTPPLERPSEPATCALSGSKGPQDGVREESGSLQVTVMINGVPRKGVFNEQGEVVIQSESPKYFSMQEGGSKLPDAPEDGRNPFCPEAPTPFRAVAPGGPRQQHSASPIPPPPPPPVNLRTASEVLNRTEVAARKGLIDGAATACLRTANEAERQLPLIPVKLACGSCNMHINACGTLLSEVPVSPILSVKALLKLGYRLDWNASRCKVYHPKFGELEVDTSTGCPEVDESATLSLIDQYELYVGEKDTKSARLRCIIEDLRERGDGDLIELIASGDSQADAALSVYVSRLFPEVSSDILEQCVVSLQDPFQDAPTWNRRTRRRCMRSQGVVVHAFCGKARKVFENVAHKRDFAHLGVDTAEDLLSDQTYRFLLQQARDGRIRGIVGAPPSRTFSAARYLSETTGQGPRPIRLPGESLGLCGISDLSCQERAQRNVDDVLYLRFMVLLALAVESNRCKGVNEGEGTQPLQASLWSTPEWMCLESRLGLTQVKFFQGPMGHVKRRPTCLGTDVEPDPVVIECSVPPNLVDYIPKHDFRAVASQWNEWSPGLAQAMSAMLHRAFGHMNYVGKEKPFVKKIDPGGQDVDSPADVDPNPAPAEGGAIDDAEWFQEGAGVRDDPDPEVSAKDLGEARESWNEWEKLIKSSREDWIREAQSEVLPKVEIVDFVYVEAIDRKTHSEVLTAVGRMYARARIEGFDVRRLHSDRGREYNNAALRSWCAKHGIHKTLAVAEEHQGNGRAEGAIYRVKSKARVILEESRAEKTDRPLAAKLGAHELKNEARRKLKMPVQESLPFNTRVQVINRSWHRETWQARTTPAFVKCPSADMSRGWVVATEDNRLLTTGKLFPSTDHGKVSFTSMGPAVDLDAPDHRVRGKSSVQSLKVSEFGPPESEVDNIAKGLYEKQQFQPRDLATVALALSQLSQDSTRMVKEGDGGTQSAKVKTCNFFAGAFSYGGLTGIKSTTRDHRWTVRYLTAYMNKHGKGLYSGIGLIWNVDHCMHRDLHNQRSVANVVLPVVTSGGGLWIEHRGMCEQCAVSEQRACASTVLSDGDSYELLEVPWPIHANVSQAADELAAEHLSIRSLLQLGEEDSGTQQCRVDQIYLQELSELERQARDMNSLERVLLEEVQLPFICSLSAVDGDLIDQRELGEEPLTGVPEDDDPPPLQTKIISQDQVRREPHKWRASLVEEFESLVERTEAVEELSDSQYNGLVEDPNISVEVIPGKADGNTQRVDLFASGVGAESIRMLIRKAALESSWHLVTVDVRTAFLQAPLMQMQHEGRQKVTVVRVPSILRETKVTTAKYWRVRKALYGLNSAPKSWSRHRDKVLSELCIPHENGVLTLRKMDEDANLWNVLKKPLVNSQGVSPEALPRDCKEEQVSVIALYVDDILIAGPKTVADTVVQSLQKQWDLSSPEWLSEEGDYMKFAGFELQKTAEGFSVNQTNYVRDLLDQYQDTVVGTERAPAVKMGSLEDPKDDDGRRALVKRAQAMVGQLLWLSGRTRPEIAYAVSMAAQKIVPGPAEAVARAEHVVKYLRHAPAVGLHYKRAEERCGKWNQLAHKQTAANPYYS
eukprot:s373_g6.t2